MFFAILLLLEIDFCIFSNFPDLWNNLSLMFFQSTEHNIHQHFNEIVNIGYHNVFLRQTSHISDYSYIFSKILRNKNKNLFQTNFFQHWTRQCFLLHTPFRKHQKYHLPFLAFTSRFISKKIHIKRQKSNFIDKSRKISAGNITRWPSFANNKHTLLSVQSASIRKRKELIWYFNSLTIHPLFNAFFHIELHFQGIFTFE